MKSLLVVLGAILGLCLMTSAHKDEEDAGTVIGIDLGTTYSW